MRRLLSPEATVGLFVLLAFGVLVWGTFQIARYTGPKAGAYTLNVYFDTAHGIAKDTPIEIAGVEMGRVQSIDFDPETQRSRVTLGMFPQAVVYEDAQVSVRTSGLLGEAFLQISPGTPTRRRLANGDTIANARSAPSLEELMGDVSKVVAELRVSAEGLAKVLGEEMTQSDLRETIANLRDSTEVLSRMLQNNEGDANRSIQAIGQKLPRILDDIAAMAASVRKLIEEQKDGVAAAVRGVTEVEERVARAFAEVEELAAKLNKGQGTLGKLLTDDQTIESVNETIDGAKKLIESVNRWHTIVGYRGEFQFGVPEAMGIKHYVNLKLQPAYDHYYYLQLVNDPEGKVTRTSTRVQTFPASVNGKREPLNTTTQVEEVTDDKFMFSLMLGKRYYDMTFKLGFIESRGGFGMDYDFLDGQVRLTAEAFNFARVGGGPVLRSRVEYNFLKYLTVTGGLSDIVNQTNRGLIYQVGAGLTIDDEDLKVILSATPAPSF